MTPYLTLVLFMTNLTNMNNRASRLKSARIESGLRQSDIARIMNRSVSTIKKWESDTGTTPSSLDDVSKLCEAVGISTDYYINGRSHRSRFSKEDIRIIELAKKMLPETKQHFLNTAEALINIQNSSEFDNT